MARRRPHLRILFSCAAGEGHLNPLVPLAQAFAADGHEVAFATAPSQADRIASWGFSFFPAGLEQAERRARFERYDVEHRTFGPDDRRAFIFPRLFGEIDAQARLPALRDAVAAWRPRLVVHESAELAAPIAAAERGLPTVHHSFGRLVPVPIVALAAARTEPLWREAGLAPEPLGGMFRGVYVDIAPPSFQSEPFPDGARVERLRPAPLEAEGGEAPRWLERLPARPTVYVTLGTVFNAPALFRVLLDGLAECDCNVVATTGRNVDPASLDPLPTNAHVERYVPQSLLLPHCSAVVAHAGSGSTLGALAFGLPLLLVPRDADQFENAAHCAAIGVGRRLLPDELTAGAVASEVQQLLEDPSYRARAQAVADEIAAMPAAAELAPLLAEAGVGWS